MLCGEPAQNPSHQTLAPLARQRGFVPRLHFLCPTRGHPVHFTRAQHHGRVSPGAFWSGGRNSLRERAGIVLSLIDDRTVAPNGLAAHVNRLSRGAAVQITQGPFAGPEDLVSCVAKDRVMALLEKLQPSGMLFKHS